MKSLGAIFLGMLLALVIALIVYPGIVGPVLSTFFGHEGGRRLAFPAGIFVFGLAFYFGGMLASYRAPSRRRLHGTLVAVISFATSVVVDFGVFFLIQTRQDPIAPFRTPRSLLATAVLFGVSVIAAYVGARRGETIYAHNLSVTRKRQQRERRRRSSG